MIAEFIGEEGFKGHPIGFAKFLLECTEISHDINGFRGWKYGPTLFDKETPFERPLDNIYTTHQMYVIFCLTYDIEFSEELRKFTIEQS